MKTITPSEINRILAVTDSMGIHREAVMVQLGFAHGGIVRIYAQKKIDITAPSDFGLDEFLTSLPQRIAALDLSTIRRV